MSGWCFAQIPWCSKLERPIDYELVRCAQPACILEMNGCGNCPNQITKIENRGWVDKKSEDEE